MKRLILLVSLVTLSACAGQHDAAADSARAVDSARADSVKADSVDTLTSHR